jgi:hypothetical protein
MLFSHKTNKTLVRIICFDPNIEMYVLNNHSWKSTLNMNRSEKTIDFEAEEETKARFHVCSRKVQWRGNLPTDKEGRPLDFVFHTKKGSFGIPLEKDSQTVSVKLQIAKAEVLCKEVKLGGEMQYGFRATMVNQLDLSYYLMAVDGAEGATTGRARSSTPAAEQAQARRRPHTEAFSGDDANADVDNGGGPRNKRQRFGRKMR